MADNGHLQTNEFSLDDMAKLPPLQQDNHPNDLLRRYSIARNEILTALQMLYQLAVERHVGTVQSCITDIRQRLEENRFNLVVFGEFKRGKSTFLNALIGREVLPTAVVPLTSVVSIVQYGETDQAFVNYLDGRHQAIELTEIWDYITETGNPKNKKGVARLEISLNSPLLKNGLQLVDTPGVGSIYKHNTRASHEFLPHADAAIFVLAADPPISSSEREFIRYVRQWVPKIFFILNKMDRLNGKEREESLAFNRTVIEKELAVDNILLIPISARLALDGKTKGNRDQLKQSNITEFEKELDAFLMRERGQIAIVSGLNGAQRMASYLLNGIDLERRAMEMPIEDLDRRLKLFNERLVEVNRQKEENSVLLQQIVAKRAVERLNNDVDEMKPVQLRLLRQRLAVACEEGNGGSGTDLLSKINQLLPYLIGDSLSQWQSEEAEKLTVWLDEQLMPYTERVNELIEQVHRISSEVFEVGLGSFHIDETLDGKGQFYVESWRIRVKFELSLTLLLRLVPEKWVKRWLLRVAAHRLWDEFELHAGQMQNEFTRRIKSILKKYADQVDDKIEKTIFSIQSAIRDAMQVKSEGEAAMRAEAERLKEQAEQVITITRNLSNVGADLTINQPVEIVYSV